MTSAIEQQRIAARAIEHAAAKLEFATKSRLQTSAEIEDAAQSLRASSVRSLHPAPLRN